MDRKKHLLFDQNILKKQFNHVHQWLDKGFPTYAKTDPYRHWIKTHNLEAIEKQFGKDKYEFASALFHVLLDFYTHFGFMYIPKDNKDAEEVLKHLDVIKKA